jgi:hypothetical protein
VRLGGFVIHGNDEATLGPCLDSLTAVADEVVAVDCGSTDLSAHLVSWRGIRRVQLPWQGYGAARAAAAAALESCHYILFLDADEYLEPCAVRGVRTWKLQRPESPFYTCRVRDWAELRGRRFLFRTQRRVRLLRRDAAHWRSGMIVHEHVPGAELASPLSIDIEHRYAVDIRQREAKNERYALLWALQTEANGRRALTFGAARRLWHTLKAGLLSGAVWRGGFPAIRLAWAASRYHALKYQRLAEVRRGAFADELELVRSQRLRELFIRLDAERRRLHG